MSRDSVVERSPREQEVPGSNLRQGTGDMIGKHFVILAVYSVHSLKCVPRFKKSAKSFTELVFTVNNHADYK